MEQSYLVRADVGRFVKDVDGHTIDVTDVPSFAKFFSYDDAAVLSDRLRKRGFPQAVVCDLRGEAMSFKKLQDQLAADSERAKRFYGEQPVKS